MKAHECMTSFEPVSMSAHVRDRHACESVFEGAMHVVLNRRSQLDWRALASTALLLTGCGGGGGGGESATSAASLAPPRPIEQTDLQIATAIYAGSARTPVGFYAETPPSGHSNVATMHVKNTDVDPHASGSTAQFELCTNDWNEALGWSETSAHNAPQYSTLVATNDDARFFEFGRVRSGAPEMYVQARVYKCAYMNRTAADLRSSSGAAGQLNVRPLSPAELRRMSEYFWQFTAYNNFGNVVLKSAGATALEHTLHIASLVRGGMSSSCDRVDVIAWRHRVHDVTGAITLDVQTLWSFGARESAGIAQLCTS
jgi:hypothetical protein